MNSLVVHIAFYYNKDRFKYINRIIEETNRYKNRTDIFIHTNEEIDRNLLSFYSNGRIDIIIRNLKDINPFLLTWKCRDLLKSQRNDYDAFMYIEDDILVPWEAIRYWNINHKEIVDDGYNLGFVRIETSENLEYITDLPNRRLKRKIEINGKTFIINDINPYCAFWIYDRHEFNKFIDSKYYDPSNINGYDTREKSAIGLHGLETRWYKGTVIPLDGNKLVNGCRIYHLPNNYIKNASWATILFDEAIDL